jgi:hypothetical protein
MKFFILQTLLLLSVVSANSETMVARYGIQNSDLEGARIDDFIEAVRRQPVSRGFVVIYTGKKDERIGNITAMIDGMKSYLMFRRFDLKRISFVIAEGQQPLFKELWLLPAN